MALNPVLIALLALAIVTERIVEIVFDIVDRITEIDGNNKKILTHIVSLVIGIAVAFIIDFDLLGALDVQIADATIGKVFTGLIVGTTAPYAHQLVELLFKVQKLAESQRKKVEGDTSSAET